jgi:hypothetical protein
VTFSLTFLWSDRTVPSACWRCSRSERITAENATTAWPDLISLSFFFWFWVFLLILFVCSHCPWIDSCIGFKNNKYFVALLLFANFAHVLWLWQGFWFLSEFGWRNHTGFALFFGFEIVQCLGQLALLFGQSKLVLLDATTFEELEHQKRVYNRGFLLNFKNFFGIAGPQQISYE